MFAYKETVDHTNESELLQLPNSTPERRLRTAWFETNLGFFWVNITVIGPKATKPKDYLPGRGTETKRQLEKIADLVLFLKKHAR